MEPPKVLLVYQIDAFSEGRYMRIGRKYEVGKRKRKITELLSWKLPWHTASCSVTGVRL